MIMLGLLKVSLPDYRENIPNERTLTETLSASLNSTA